MTEVGNSTDIRTGKQVLVVDDEPGVRKVISSLLTRDDRLEVLTASGAPEAQKLIEGEPDLVLLDLDLGESKTDGIGFLRMVRNTGFNKTICIVTGDESTDRLFHALWAGADDFILKSDLSDHIYKKVDQLLFAPAQLSACDERFHPSHHGAYLLSRGLTENQVDLLARWFELDCPPPDDSAGYLGMEANQLTGQLSQIMEALGIEDLNMLTRLLTTLSLFVARRTPLPLPAK